MSQICALMPTEHARTDEQNFSFAWVFIWPCSTIQLDPIDLNTWYLVFPAEMDHESRLNWGSSNWEYIFLSDQISLLVTIPSGKLSHNYGKIHYFQWVNPLFLWPFSIAMSAIIRGFWFLQVGCGSSHDESGSPGDRLGQMLSKHGTVVKMVIHPISWECLWWALNWSSLITIPQYGYIYIYIYIYT